MASLEKVVTIVVEAANRPPVESPDFPASIPLKVGETYDFKPLFTDPDGDALALSLVGQSELVTMVDGVVTAIAPGTAEITVRADDGHA